MSSRRKKPFKYSGHELWENDNDFWRKDILIRDLQERGLDCKEKNPYYDIALAQNYCKAITITVFNYKSAVTVHIGEDCPDIYVDYEKGSREIYSNYNELLENICLRFSKE